ncbi:MAG: hypothetical protein IKJ91_09405 [Clostridia bacterium]|nr:hypothetical protein [Clostridia bacterium]
MLYNKNREKTLSDDLFKNPTSEYRGAPFWAWNTELDEAELLRQIDIFKEMGIGGFHMHVRSGMATKYLSDEYMSLIKSCTEKAKKKDMLAWLYDEDRWASGAAGGYVTKNYIYRRKSMIITAFDPDNSSLKLCKNYSEFCDSANKGICPDGYHVARFEIILDKDGYLIKHRQKTESEDADENTWYAYIKVDGNDPWFNGEAYIDAMKDEAVDKFIEITHERYAEVVGDNFGKTIPAIFTDEPQVKKPKYLTNSTEKGEVILPFTDDMEETYQKHYGESLISRLPEIVWQTKDDSSAEARYRYIDHRCERFASAFCDNIGKWCHDHGIALTGHLMEEPTLKSQSNALGEAMRCYREFEIPGIDMLCGFVELSTAKQTQSAVHQYGREAMLSELYGVTGWDYDFGGHKSQGDWQAALGVTIRVHHLTWVSMNGEAKRDYPASIGYQSPWYKEYSKIEDHFARLNTALTRGKPSVRVAVIHPIESYWLHCGVNDKTALRRSYLDRQFNELTKSLAYCGIDFDFISESLFPSLSPVASNPLRVGEMEYDCVIVPALDTMRSTTLERLQKFSAEGGNVIILGKPAQMVDAKRCDKVILASKEWKCLDIDYTALIDALDEYRFVDFTDKETGIRYGNFLHQIRNDGENGEKWFFICHGEASKDRDRCENVHISFDGCFDILEYDTLSGNIFTPNYSINNGKTYLEKSFYSEDSLLLRLIPSAEVKKNVTGDAKANFSVYCGGEKILPIDNVPYTLSEENVLLLDRCEFAFDDGEWESETDSLLVSDNGRSRFYKNHVGQRRVQPWIELPADVKNDLTPHVMKRRFTFRSDIPLNGAHLAMELSDISKIKFDGREISNISDGYFTDKCIKTLLLPAFSSGTHTIEIETPFELRTCSEWCYIVGDFGVEVKGKYAKIVKKPDRLVFGNAVNQALPFYTGNITYHTSFTEPEGKERTLQIPHFSGALIKIVLDGNDLGHIMTSPFCIELGMLSKGEHTLDITVFGTRGNAFGAVHNTKLEEEHYWYGPGAWRTHNEPEWSDAYVLKKTGLIDTPIIF